ncbi:hypothetical protein ACIRBY_25740 [Streptomyces sp. NPDC096136]|uniref:hypothetical protein n=1 Tax=Streptomyces sp. NPDC096136 TaxID=3366076 RepID=UPI003819AE9A
MTDWSRLRHAYGCAEDIPALLEQIASEPSPEHWSDLWSALCHQGSVYSASFAALPWLAEVAGGDDREQAVSALNLAGAILAGSEQSHGAGGDVRALYAAETETLLALVHAHLRTAPDRTEYTYLLECMLGFEGVMSWSEELAWGLVSEEYAVTCPGCRVHLFIAIGAYGFFSTSSDYALAEHEVETRPLRPVDPAAMAGIGRRLHRIALADGQQELADALTYVFGDATCPDCGTDFSVADRITGDRSAAG